MSTFSFSLSAFRWRGGVHPYGRKEATASQAIASLPLPPRLFIPLQQHIGAPAEPEVKVGQRVLKGERLARHQGMISAPVHAPTSGVVSDITDYLAPHPSGLTVRTLVLEVDGDDLPCSAAREPQSDPLQLAPREIAQRVGAAGIVGMGGATFPAAVKLNLGARNPIHTLVINGAECEPYLTCDDRLMRERSGDILLGVRLMAKALGVERVIIAIEGNKPEALRILSAAATALADAITVVPVPTRYPMGSEKHLVLALTGEETPAQGLTADLGIVVHNVATAYAVQQALACGRPLISRVVTVSGGAIAQPQNLEVPLGTPIQALIDHCGGFTVEPARLLMGGPMMGQLMPSTQVPIVKGSSGLLALTAAELAPSQADPCIRCGSCVAACPCGLLPLTMAAKARAGDLDGAAAFGLMDCVACGSCSYACPSHIPLVQYFQYAKGALTARQRAAHKNEETKRLAQARQARIEAQKRAKAEAAAARKAAKRATTAAAEG